MDKDIIDKLIYGFNFHISEVKASEAKLEILRTSFVHDFTFNAIGQLTKDKYCAGLN